MTSLLGILRMPDSPAATSLPAAPTEFDAFMKAAVDAIVVIENSGEIVAFSASAEKMFGYEEVEGMIVWIIQDQAISLARCADTWGFDDDGVQTMAEGLVESFHSAKQWMDDRANRGGRLPEIIQQVRPSVAKPMEKVLAALTDSPQTASHRKRRN